MAKKFVGAIAFLDSESGKEGRLTLVMSFGLAAEWVASVKEYYTQEVMSGNYDGSEVLVTVYEYVGQADVYERATFWNYDTNVVGSLSINNPYYI
jgi:hypothetical protein